MAFVAGVPTPLVIGRTHDPAVVSPVSPRLGVDSEQTAIDLDEVEYTAPSGEYWLHPCAWLKQPRVRQFCRWKFLSVILALTLTGVFLAGVITFMTVPKQPAALESTPEEPTPETPIECTRMIWPPGWIIIRDPTELSRLLVYDQANTNLTVFFNITAWDHVASFDGYAIHLYGPSVYIDEADNGYGAIGLRDVPSRHNSWGVLMDRYLVNETKMWFGKEIIDPYLVMNPSSTSNPDRVPTFSSSSSSSSTGGSARTNSSDPSGALSSSSTGSTSRRPFWNGGSSESESSTGGTDGTDTGHDGSTGTMTTPTGPVIPVTADGSAYLSARRFYFFNNRTDVHMGAYQSMTSTPSDSGSPSSPASPSESSNTSSSTGAAAQSSTGSNWISSTGPAGNSTVSPITPATPAAYNPLPFWTLQLFLNDAGTQLSFCSERFVLPVFSSSSSTGGTVRVSSTGASARSSTGAGPKSSTGISKSSTGASAAASSTSVASTNTVSDSSSSTGTVDDSSTGITEDSSTGS